MPHSLTNAIKEALAAAANPDYATAMQGYMKSEMPFRGVKSDPLRKITQGIFRSHPPQDFEAYIMCVKELWDGAEYREECYAAIGLAEKYPKFQILEALPLYRHMIETGAWWDYVDMIAQHLIGGLLERHPDVMKPEMRRWIKDPHLWIRRSAVLSQNRFRAVTDEVMLFEFCAECLAEKEFWMRKAIGWALREYSKANPDSVRRFVEQNRLKMSGVTLREAEKYV